MTNRIHQIMQLDDGKKYMVFKQAIYKEENYYLVVEVDEKEDPLDNFRFLHEVTEGEDTYVKPVTDEKMIELLIKYLKLDQPE